MTADDKPRRRLSDEDLWRSVTRTIVPLKRTRGDREPVGTRLVENKSVPSTRPRAAATHLAPVPKASPPLMPIDRRLKQRLARGHIEIEARLDLHGRTQ